LLVASTHKVVTEKLWLRGKAANNTTPPTRWYNQYLISNNTHTCCKL
jgi:hypothetical protein